MDLKPKELEEMAADMRHGIEPPTTPGEVEDAMLTEVFRIVTEAGGKPDLLHSQYAQDFMTISYDGHEFAHYNKEPGGVLWIAFQMYPALRAKYSPDPRFASVQDKDSDYWRVDLRKAHDVREYADVIVDETL